MLSHPRLATIAFQASSERHASMTTSTIETWHTDRRDEDEMGPSHVPIWRRMIALVQELDLAQSDVLDFGCNQGGFLRQLYAARPFRRGVGVDIATTSLAIAAEMGRRLPIDYLPSDRLAEFDGRFHLAFSHEVVYLVSDLDSHAATILSALRPGGVYYAATACHTANRLWPAWRRAIERHSNLAFPDRSPEEYANAFRRAGFAVSVRPFGLDEFLDYDGESEFYPTIADRIYAAREAKLLFRLVKAG